MPNEWQRKEEKEIAMANKKTTKATQDKLVEDFFCMSPAEHIEIQRYAIEMEAMDESFFIPINFDLIEKDKKLFAYLYKEHCKRKGVKKVQDTYKISYEEMKNIFAAFDKDLKIKYRIDPKKENVKDLQNDPRFWLN